MSRHTKDKVWKEKQRQKLQEELNKEQIKFNIL